MATHTVAVGVDPSGLSDEAVAWAAKWAADHHATLDLVHVIDDEWVGRLTWSEELILAESRKALTRARELARPALAEDAIRDVLLRGDPVDQLRQRASETDLLVIGTHKPSRFERVMLGSRSLHIVQSVTTPVAVIPSTDGAERRGVVVGVDGSEASLKAIAFAAAEADRSGEPLHAVLAWDLPAGWGIEYLPSDDMVSSISSDEEIVLSESLAGLSEQYPDLEIKRSVVRGYPAWALVDAAESARLLVVGNRGRRGLPRVLLGSVSHDVLVNIPTAVVVIHA
ncbi:universal stress protein [Ruicaihuangia caeni]|uniref:Universal stress protein n=1 Tax=Ruicaihuangia caeni TaxID=3042517 RepID=A0AAW6T741_9MICO|nr:universal stress protein [Klugiella sp. YN-L-19]MDI2098173.1 universal stress protein [Klugiella sp. YN-L-19]